MNSPKENFVEGYLEKRVRELGGKCLKFSSPGTAGVADRIVLLPGGVFAFVETKRLGDRPRPLQAKFAREVESLGHLCACIDRREDVGPFLERLIRG